jgi:general secretion pathway protein K
MMPLQHPGRAHAQAATAPLHRKGRQAGAALLAAMLTVTLVATLAAAAMWQQWRAVEVETAERGRVQAAWILVGALDWSRVILGADGRAGGADHLAEPWAIPLQEARLSTFLAAERNVSQVEDASTDTADAFLSGQITDMQSRLNLTSLVDGGQVQAGALKQFTRLFERLGLPAQQLTALVDALRKAQAPTGTEDADVPLMPQTVSQLGWLGVPASTIAILEPHITILPGRTSVNLNTAQLDVLWAAVDGMDLASAQKLIAARESRHFRELADATALLGSNTVLNGELHGTGSRYFEVRGRLRIGEAVVDERSLVTKDGAVSTILWRQRGTFDSNQAATSAQALR